MANICENVLYAYSEDEKNLDFIKKFIEDNFDADVDYCDDNGIDGYFDSRWTFPEEIMEQMIDELPNKKDETLYLRCLSVEYGCLYHALHICENIEDGWQDV